MFDTHAHVNFNSYKDDSDAVMKRALDKRIAVVNVGSQYSTSVRAVEIAEKYQGAHAAIGLHPIHLTEMDVVEEGVAFTTRKEEFNYAAYRELAQNKKVIAIGESGLDFYRINGDREMIINAQKAVFKNHIKLANDVDLPIIVHCRGEKENPMEAYGDILKELKDNPVKRGGIMHCYVGDPELIPDILELGFYISFNGVLTFDKTGQVEKILLNTPDERILTETDCPFLTPVPYRGKRNEPAFVEFVVQKIADIKKWDFERAAALTRRNALKLFNLDDAGLELPGYQQ